MDAFVSVLQFIGDEILNVPAYLIGIIVAIGLIALRRSVGQVVGGALKAALGFLILGAGAGVVTSSLTPLGDLVLAVTGAPGVVPTNEVLTAQAASEFGATSAYILSLGVLLMLILVRFSPLKYVFLTGHHMVFMAMLLAVVMSVGFGQGFTTVLVGAVLLAVIMVVMPAFAHPWTKRITGTDTIAMGHFSTLGYIAAGATGQAVGKNSRSTEDIKFPKGLAFLRDSTVATALSMVLIYLVFTIWGLISLGDGAYEYLGSATAGSFIMAGIMQALMFGVGVAVILFGVRTFLGELIPAFQGIAERVVPGAKAALDIPVVFPYAQNAVLIGFLASFAGGLFSLMLLGLWLGPAFGLALILPGMVPHFFTGGGAGVYGNATGGRRGAVLGGFVNGILITFLPAFLLNVMGDLSVGQSTFGDTDFGWFGTAVGLVAQVESTTLGIILCLIVAAVLFAVAWVWQVRVVDRGWMPAAERQDRLDAESAAAKASAEQERAARRAARGAKQSSEGAKQSSE